MALGRVVVAIVEAVTVAAAKVAAEKAVTVREVVGVAVGEMEVAMGPTEVAVGGSGEEGGGEGGGGDGGGERRGGERHDHEIDRAQSARLGADQRDARLRPGWDRPGDALAGAGRRDTGEVSPGVGLRQQGDLGGAQRPLHLLVRVAPASRQHGEVGSGRAAPRRRQLTAAHGLGHAGCRLAGRTTQGLPRTRVAGVVEVGSRRVAQAGDAGVVPRTCARLGTECGTRAAESKG